MKSRGHRHRASVLDCASPLALCNGSRKRQRTAAVQNLAGVNISQTIRSIFTALPSNPPFAGEFAPANPYPLTE